VKPTIKNWYVTWEKGNAFIPPEMRRKGIIGQIFGSDHVNDGTEICIVLDSRVSMDGRTVKTVHDGEFELGEPEPEYLKWLITSGVGYDEIHPIKFVDELKHGSLEGKRPPDGGRGRQGAD
jgi:hypothetical protein